MNTKNIKKIGFVIKHNQAEATQLALEVGSFLTKRGFEMVYCDENQKALLAAQKLGQSKGAEKIDAKLKLIPKEDLPHKVDFIIVMGGDGTYLSAARLMKEKSIPILGVNMGTLGFLTEVKKEEIYDTLHRIFAKNELHFSLRTMLEVSVIRKSKVAANEKAPEKTILQGIVVNDAVISKGAIARIIGVKVTVDGSWANTVRADGVIISTPTGSTAYSLAAGGPIVMPGLGCILVTPVCPHGLTQRTLILSDKKTIELTLDHTPGNVYLTLDGQEAVDLREGDVIRVSRFNEHKLKIVSAPNRDYFMLLREKLRFGEK